MDTSNQVMTSLPPAPDAVTHLVHTHGVQTTVANAEKMDLTVHTYVTVLMMNRKKVGKNLILPDNGDEIDED